MAVLINPFIEFPVVSTGTVWNPSDKSSSVTLSNGNTVATGANPRCGVRAVTSHSGSGKYYFAMTVTGISSNPIVGAFSATGDFTSAPAISTNGIEYTPGGAAANSSGTLGTFTGYTVGDTIGIAIDFGNSKWYVAVNGTWQNSADPVAGTGGFTGISGTYFPAGSFNGSGDILTLVTGSPPSGYSQWG